MARSLRARVLAAALAAASLAAAGCWPQPGGTSGNQNWNPVESGLTIANVATLAPAWTAPGDLDLVFGRHVVGVVGGRNGTPGSGFVRIESLDAATGTANWSTPIAPVFIAQGLPTGSAVVVGDEVWAGWLGFSVGPRGSQSCGGGSTRVELETGARQGDLGLLSSVVPFGGLAAVHQTSFETNCTFGPDSGLRVLDAPTVQPAWQSTAAGGSRLVETGDRLVDIRGTTVRSFTASGCGAAQCAPVWTADLGVELFGLVADGDRLYTTTGPSGPAELLGLDRSDGTIVWRAPLPAPAGLTAFGGTVYAAAGTTLSAYDGAGCVTTCHRPGRPRSRDPGRPTWPARAACSTSPPRKAPSPPSTPPAAGPPPAAL